MDEELNAYLAKLEAIIETYEIDCIVCERLRLPSEAREIAKFTKTLNRLKEDLENIVKKDFTKGG